MLKETELSKGALLNGKNDFGGYIVQPPTKAPTLEELGISKIQSFRWQLEAEVPDEKVR